MTGTQVREPVATSSSVYFSRDLNQMRLWDLNPVAMMWHAGIPRGGITPEPNTGSGQMFEGSVE